MPKSPCVFIVGAGPGDPGLITVRGLRHLETADVVVYDHQVHARLLRSARRRRREDRRRPGGTAAARPGRHLAAARREGARGQDRRPPQVGRSVRVRQRRQGSAVPARAADPVRGRPGRAGGDRRSPAYAGIPITYPGAGDVVTLVRGHEAETDEPPQVDWDRLAGHRRHAGLLRRRAPGRRDRGRAPRQRPLAGRERRADLRRHDVGASRRSSARSATIAATARPSEPAMLVIGARRRAARAPALVRRSPAVRPAHRRHARRASRRGELVDMLEERGAEAIQTPTIRIAPPDDIDALDRACADAGGYDWIVFTSANAVESFMRPPAAARRHPRPEGRAALRDRAVDGAARVALRHCAST